MHMSTSEPAMNIYIYTYLCHPLHAHHQQAASPPVLYLYVHAYVDVRACYVYIHIYISMSPATCTYKADTSPAGSISDCAALALKLAKMRSAT